MRWIWFNPRWSLFCLFWWMDRHPTIFLYRIFCLRQTDWPYARLSYRICCFLSSFSNLRQDFSRMSSWSYKFFLYNPFFCVHAACMQYHIIFLFNWSFLYQIPLRKIPPPGNYFGYSLRLIGWEIAFGIPNILSHQRGNFIKRAVICSYIYV